MNRIRSRVASAATALAVFAVTVGAVPVADVPARADSGVSEEAPAFARERDISLAEAERRLSWQAVAPDLAEQLESSLADRYGGVWIDERDADRVKIGIASRIDARTAEIVRSAAAAVGLTEGYDLVTVPRSMPELAKANDWLADEMARTDEGAKVSMSAGIRTDLNAVELQVPTRDRLTSAQLDLVKRAADTLGAALLLSTNSAGYDAFACTGMSCDPPLRGGVRISGPTNCTAGFVSRSRVDEKQYLITAGHCGMLLGTWSSRFSDNSSKVIGPVWHWEWNKNGDAAIIRIDDVANWDPQARVLVTAGPETTQNQLYAISEDKLNVVGMRICATGATTGMSRCGKVTELGFSVAYGAPGGPKVRVNKLGRASVCGKPGDSGSPMYAKHIAFGVLVGGASNGDCDTIFQGIRGAENLLNVNVRHTAS